MKNKMKPRMRVGIPSEESVKEGIYLLVMKSLLFAYVITGTLLMLLAFLLYKMDLNQQQVAIGIIVIYVIANFCGGFVSGKFIKEKKYLWGMVEGFLYVILLLAITFGVYRTLNQANFMTTIILCVCSGMIGGMLS